MASTKADNNRVAWTYTDDESQDWAISAKAVYVLDGTDGSKYGGAAATASDRRIPADIKPRKVKMSASGQPDKYVIAYDSAATIWTTPGTTLTLCVNGVDVVYTAQKQKRRERTRDTTRDAA